MGTSKEDDQDEGVTVEIKEFAKNCLGTDCCRPKQDQDQIGISPLMLLPPAHDRDKEIITSISI